MTDTATATEPEVVALDDSTPNVMHIGGPEPQEDSVTDDAQPDGAVGSPPSDEAAESAEEEPNPELVQLRETSEKLQQQNDSIVNALRRRFGENWTEVLAGEGPSGSATPQEDPVEAFIKERFQESDAPHLNGLVDLIEKRTLSRIEEKFGPQFESFESTRRESAYERALLENGLTSDDLRSGAFKAYEKHLMASDPLLAAGKKAMPQHSARHAAMGFLAQRSRSSNPDSDALSRSRSAPSLDRRGGASGGGGRKVTIRTFNGIPYHEDLQKASEQGFEPEQYVFTPA